MAIKETAQAGDLALAATWVGGLPAEGDDVVIKHDVTYATNTLPALTGITFDGGSLWLQNGADFRCFAILAATDELIIGWGTIYLECGDLTIASGPSTGYWWGIISGSPNSISFTLNGTLTCAGFYLDDDDKGDVHAHITGNITSITDYDPGLWMSEHSVLDCDGDIIATAGTGQKGALVAGELTCNSLTATGGSGAVGAEVSGTANVTTSFVCVGGTDADGLYVTGTVDCLGIDATGGDYSTTGAGSGIFVGSGGSITSPSVYGKGGAGDTTNGGYGINVAGMILAGVSGGITGEGGAGIYGGSGIFSDTNSVLYGVINGNGGTGSTNGGTGIECSGYFVGSVSGAGGSPAGGTGVGGDGIYGGATIYLVGSMSGAGGFGSLGNGRNYAFSGNISAVTIADKDYIYDQEYVWTTPISVNGPNGRLVLPQTTDVRDGIPFGPAGSFDGSAQVLDVGDHVGPYPVTDGHIGPYPIDTFTP